MDKRIQRRAALIAILAVAALLPSGATADAQQAAAPAANSAPLQ